MTNLSLKQFILEFIFRRFKTVDLDAVPHYTFKQINQEDLENVVLPEKREFFVMIKPSGLHKEAEIKQLIAQFNLTISREETYFNFSEIASHIFDIAKIHDYRHRLPEGYIWLKLLEYFYPEACQRTKILYIQDGNEKVLNRLKKRIRQKIGVEFYRVQIHKQYLVTCMTPVHTSEQNTLERELKILQYFRNSY
jgi:hypothetical protein